MINKLEKNLNFYMYVFKFDNYNKISSCNNVVFLIFSGEGYSIVVIR